MVGIEPLQLEIDREEDGGFLASDGTLLCARPDASRHRSDRTLDSSREAVRLMPWQSATPSRFGWAALRLSHPPPRNVTLWFCKISIEVCLILRSLVAVSVALALQPLWGQTAPARVPQGESTESQFSVSLSLFATLAAINAAGYDTGIDSPLNDQFLVRREIRAELAKKTIASLPDLREFYKAHKKPTPGADLGQYISFALVVGDAPNFILPAADLPPEVEAIRGFSELLARFYKDADLEGLWNRSQQAYAAAIGQYQDAVINTIFEANGYLRNPSGYLGRRFQIYLDLLGAPDQVQVRSYKNDYFVVITPTSVPVVDEIRDAYLAYILDPLTYKYSTVIKEKQSLAKYADQAPALDVAYKDDFSLLLTKSLIKAIDSRLLRGGDTLREAAVNEAMRQGFILTAVFAECLTRYEHQPDSMKLYYPDMLAAIDVKREKKRLETVQFAQSAPNRVVAAPAKLKLDPVEENLQNAEGVYEQGNYELAGKIFKFVLQETTDKSFQGRAYYGLGRIAIRQNERNQAVNYFTRTAEYNPNPTLTAWSHVYLGRLAIAAGKPDKAYDEFKLALSIDGASQMAKEAAEKALENSSTSGDKKQ
jgi:predicted negative regulator of RcsB-dependent stress response